MSRECYVYSEQELTPRAADVLSKIKTENGWDDVTFIPYRRDTSIKRVLVFGRQLPEDALGSVEYIHTYSIAQIMAKANAVTVLDAALRMYFNGRHEPTITGTALNWCVNSARQPQNLGFQYDRPIAVDIETDGNLGKTHTPEEINIISIAMYDGGNTPLVWVNQAPDGTCLPLSNKQIEMFREELPKYTKAIYHNGKFDTRVLNRVLGVTLNVWFDTMLAHHVLNIAAGEHGLKALAQRYLGADDWEDGIKQFLKGGGHYERIPFLELVKYNGWDVYWTYRLWELFEPQIEADENNQMAFELEMAAAKMLLKVEQYGIPFSPLNASALSSDQEKIMDERRELLQKLTKKPEFNPNSPQQVKQALTDQSIYVSSTSVEIIEELQKQYQSSWVQDFCAALLDYRKASKIKGTYADGWAKHARHDGQGFRVRPTFLVHGTSTGRLSSTGPNAQNVPRDKKVRTMVALESEE